MTENNSSSSHNHAAPNHDAQGNASGRNRPQRRRGRSGRPGGGGGRGGSFSQDGGSYDPHGTFQPGALPAPVEFDEAAHPHGRDKIELPEAFAKLGLMPSILHSLAEINFSVPSEIQEKLIPVALSGVDVLGQARTGTGKTAAFGLPMLQKLDLNSPFQAIIVVPTRELAVQVDAELRRFANHKPVRFALSYGGQKISGQLKQMGHHPHVVVGTPGRILDLVERGALQLQNMKFVICDEVDRMFDIGFREDIRRILGHCTSPHQTIFVSATISDDIERMVSKHMKNPVRIFTSNKDEQLTAPSADQFYVGVEPWDKQRALKLLIREEKPELAIIFCRTKRSVDKVAEGLTRDNLPASPIHGDLQQNKRERIMRGFKTGKIHILVATDLASRGIDVHEVTHVFNYDIPEDPEAYVHRVGRTARMGAKGRAFTFISRGQGQMQTEIEKLTNQLMTEFRIEGFVPNSPPNGGGRAPQGGRGGHGGHGGNDQPPHGHNAPQHQQQKPAAPQRQEGYMPTGFSNVPASPSSAPRPLSGRFPTKRRR